jgi:hypothetical protein
MAGREWKQEPGLRKCAGGFGETTFASSNQTEENVMTRQLLLKLPMACFALTLLLSTAYGGTASMNVTVFDATEKVVFKQSITENATFATGNLRAGKYVVQFNSTSPAVKNNLYLAVVSAGRKKVIAASVPGDKFMAGGAAMKIDVGPGLNISGKVAPETVTAQGEGPVFRVIDGKRYFWVNAQIGTNFAGQWVEEGLPPRAPVILWTADELRKRMDRGGEGSMLGKRSYVQPMRGY